MPLALEPYRQRSDGQSRIPVHVPASRGPPRGKKRGSEVCVLRARKAPGLEAVAAGEAQGTEGGAVGRVVPAATATSALLGDSEHGLVAAFRESAAGPRAHVPFLSGSL